VDLNKLQSDTLEEAYEDRNLAVMLLARLALLQTWPMGVREDPAEPGWSLLFIDLPCGQVSWHLPTEEIVGKWPHYDKGWDGHSLWEKRQRLRLMIWRLSSGAEDLE